jgi:hypothetical protein
MSDNLVPELRAVIEAQREEIEHLTNRRRYWQEVNETTTDDLRKEVADNDRLRAENERLRDACVDAVDLPELIGQLEHEHRQHLRACIETDVAGIMAKLRAALTPPPQQEAK